MASNAALRVLNEPEAVPELAVSVSCEYPSKAQENIRISITDLLKKERHIINSVFGKMTGLISPDFNQP
jgi:hypothetical protein